MSLCLLLFACSSRGVPQPHPKDPRPIIAGGGWMAMECSERCDVRLTLNGRRLDLRWQDSVGKPVRHASGRLTDDGLARLTSIEAALADQRPSASPPSRCYDCAERYLTVRRDGAEITYRYDDYSRPPPLTDADRFIRGLITSLTGCKTNANIRETGGRCATW